MIHTTIQAISGQLKIRVHVRKHVLANVLPQSKWSLRGTLP